MAYTILIADDDRDHLLMLAFKLRRAGYTVVSATDAKNALQLAVEKTPDLLVLDIHLGDEAGFAIQQKLSKLEGAWRTPVIYMTGDSSASTRMMAESLGAQALVLKPVEWSEFLGVVEQALTVREFELARPALECAEAYIG